MQSGNDRSLINQIKSLLSEIANLADYVEISFIEQPHKAVFYKISDMTSIADVKKVQIIIEEEVKKLGLKAIQDTN